MKLEIVMFNMSNYSEWEKGVVNRNYHIFNNLLQHSSVARIIAVDFLPFTFKRAIRNYWENIIRGSHGEVIYRDLTTTCTKVDGYPSELYVFSTIDSIFSHTLATRKLNKILNRINQQSSINNHQSTIRIIWSYFPMFVNYFSAKGGSASDGNGIKSDITVFDAVDNWIEHPSFVKFKSVLYKNYQTITDKSNLIFTVAEPLVDFLSTLGREKDIHWIPNGIDIDHFTANTQYRRSDHVDDIKGIPRPIVGYVGTIENRVDIDLVRYIASRHKNKSFVFVGPVWKEAAIKKLKSYTNVYFLGRKPYTLVPAYIKQFDLCIIPHKLDAFIKYTYSLKMLEYLIIGKPVISTATYDTARFSDYLYIAKDYNDFSNKIDLSMKSDTIEARKKRIERVKEEDWKLKVEEMMKIIKQKIKNKKEKTKT
ncbi:glycosyltransferase [Patescibacteria group bacterium AH-259-L07]|nr:glycosyltransferase [Patescibacteria group bacterium AH-259-L07]